MNGELLAVLEHMEREKGIKKDILIEAVELALVSAVKRIVELKPGVEVKVTLDRQTGKIKAFAGDEEIQSQDFGRIAASTAKQVIIQKIREAEKDVVFNEFNAKVGEIINGTVYRFEKGNMIVDLMGKAEGLVPKSGQIPSEQFRQGQRISAYLCEVKRDAKGPQIILSRAHPNFVKKLFTLEVPEIYEGILEIRSIARSPGERTKIAVWSRDEKIDSVGSCVGMRGARVKNIVTELHGERIDIVRYSEDIHTFIAESLKPAEISEIRLGKHGQNVRLASRLVGWELDIRTKETLVEATPEPEAKKKEQKELKETPFSLDQLSGVGEKTKSSLIEAGFSDIESMANASVEALSEVKGIGKIKAKKLIEQAKELVTQSKE